MSTARRMQSCSALLLVAALALAGCEKAPPGQGPLPRVEMTGVATAGPATGANTYVVEASARGSDGRPRTAVGSREAQRYAVSLTDLAGPYVLTALLHGSEQDARLYSLALEQGTANITPLTTLLLAQLYGQDPAAVFQSFGPGGADPARITAANLQEAEQQLRTLLAEELGITLPGNLGNLITAPFQPAAGDPVYDSIAAIAAALESRNLTLGEFTIEMAQAARLCRIESVTITQGGRTSSFCPLTKSATPDDDDAAHIEYLYVDRKGNTLGVVVDGDAVTSASYQNAAGDSWLCAGAACADLMLEAPEEDGSRPMQFDALTLGRDEGTITIDGRLTGAIPGVALPVLSCDSNFYFVIFADSAMGSCANADPYGFGMSALLGNLSGVEPYRVQYDFDSLDGDPARPRLSVLTDANDAVLAVQFFDYEPDTYTPRRTFACRLVDCNGVTLGEVTVNTDILGPEPPILIRTVTLQNTVLKGYDAEGNETGETATLRASVNTAYFDFVAGFYQPPIEYPPPGSCDPANAAIAAAAGATGFDLCLTPTGTALEQLNGDVVLVAGNSMSDGLRVVLRDGAVIEARIRIYNQPLDFLCRNDCAGIEVAAPDADGLRTLDFDGAVLHETFLDVLSGPRSLRLDGGTVVFDAQIPWP